MMEAYWLRIDSDGVEHREPMTDEECRDPQRAARRLPLPALAVFVIEVDGKLFEETRTQDVGERKHAAVMVKPRGEGWILHDASHDKHTVWRREVYK